MAKEKIEAQPIVNPGDLSVLLIEYREKAGYTLNQMADALCLSEETIEKLENEDFSALAEPPYIRGYLRNYAKMAELDPGDLITRYEALRGADPGELDYHFKTASTIHTRSKKRVSPIIGQLFFLSLLVAIIAGISMIPAVNQWISTTWKSFSSQTNSQDIIAADNPLLTGTMPVPSPLPLDDNEAGKNNPQAEATAPTESSSSRETMDKGEPTTNTTSNETNSQTPETTQTQKPPATTDAAADNTKSQEQAATTPNNPTVTDSDTINVKLVFNKEVWMRIKDKNKKTLFEATNSAGNEKVLKLKKPVTFRVGNAQGLSLYVNDKPVDISGYTKGSVANFTLE